MIAAPSLLLPQSQHTFTICAVLSLVFHAGLLAGLGLITKSPTNSESIPVVKVTLMAVGSDTPSESTAQPQPSMPSPLRSVRPPSPALSTSSSLSMTQPVSITSSIKPLTTPNTPEPLPTSQEKRVLKDHQATNALISHTLMKMAKSPSRASPTLPMPKASPLNLTSRKTLFAPEAMVTSAPSSNETASMRSAPSTKKILMARPPGGQGMSGSKVGIIRSIPPIYPRMARESGLEGTVILRVLVRTSGIPGDVKIRKSSGHAILDKAATEAVRKWRFKPQKDGNIPIPKYVDIPLKFDLHS